MNNEFWMFIIGAVFILRF